ncbi:MAG TPA: pyruvate dehydrogenase complex dihydrolipoamide acetyltransferase [Ferrovibrio sp.]|uniref:pyruvate dehydrogenase complex dihydrolipoamide acetyltransferase n=1 Tax=Ferrovibrio sp. TaxID=1917215 RepID=UPI002B4B167B|nr:pyruvate dehydrogenase complex dihydrolipoamide acetyltransferase [Ferrovibrio sp.]HLT79290.1 pyruvate dehydrogenase complex dihydrolipoamide acetyltransferase [Ferrovibrio sp.]
MPIEILMPALSPTMTEGKLATWHKREGDTVKAGDIIAEIETDKATMEFEAVDEGVLGKILVAEGTDGVAVNTPIALLLEEGESAADLKAPAAKPQPQAGGKKTEEKKADGKTPEPARAEEQKPEPKPAEAPKPAAAPAASGERIFASPLARRMAEQAGIDLRSITGSGPRGRIVKADVEKAPKGAAAPAGKAAAPVAAGPVSSGPGARQLADLLKMPYRLEPLSGMRRTIARRLTESKQTVPHFYLTIDTEIDELLSLRRRLNDKSEVKISVNDFVIRAVALALKKVPTANASYDESGMMYYEHADISVAVATPNGLITPIVKQAESKGLTQIASEMKDLAARARDGKLKPEEYQGGTFSISNLGMYGIRQFEAVINPPQGCILAIGMGEQRPVVKNGQIVPATVMTCTLSVDHRAVDGAVGAEFLQAFKGFIDDPLTMLL